MVVTRSISKFIFLAAKHVKGEPFGLTFQSLPLCHHNLILFFVCSFVKHCIIDERFYSCAGLPRFQNCPCLAGCRDSVSNSPVPIRRCTEKEAASVVLRVTMRKYVFVMLLCPRDVARYERKFPSKAYPVRQKWEQDYETMSKALFLTPSLDWVDRSP